MDVELGILVTVLFADLKGSMELLADRDPEEARKLIDPVLERMMEAVHHHEGTVNQVMGDGIMALFGAPLAHEDHAMRACYAALRVQESVKRDAEGVSRSYGVPIRIRVGPQLGRGRGALDRQRPPHGLLRRRPDHAPGRPHGAARGARQHPAHRRDAPPGRGFRPGHPARPGARSRGLPNRSRCSSWQAPVPPAPASRPRRGGGSRASSAAPRSWSNSEPPSTGQARATARWSPWSASRVWASRVSSREFLHSHRVHGWLIVQSASVFYDRVSAYLPVIELLRGYFAIDSRDDPRKIREKVTGKTQKLAPAFGPVVPALVALLDAPVDEASWHVLDPRQRRQQTLDAVKRLLLRESEVQPWW